MAAHGCWNEGDGADGGEGRAAVELRATGAVMWRQVTTVLARGKGVPPAMQCHTMDDDERGPGWGKAPGRAALPSALAGVQVWRPIWRWADALRARAVAGHKDMLLNTRVCAGSRAHVDVRRSLRSALSARDTAPCTHVPCSLALEESEREHKLNVEFRTRAKSCALFSSLRRDFSRDFYLPL